MKTLLTCWLILFSELIFAASSHELRSYIERLDAGAEPVIAGRQLQLPQQLAEFYRNNQYTPLWTAGAASQHRLQELLAAIRESQAHGLTPNNYHLQQLTTQAQANLVVEVLATDAFLAQVQHRAIGAVSPHDLDPGWRLPRMELDAESVLTSAVDNNSVGQSLAQLWPQHFEYWLLIAKRAELLELGETHTEPIPPGPALKPGQTNERVRLLKHRLLGPGEHSPDFDEALRTTVIAFQDSAGLETDGIVGPASLEVLNATNFSWIDRIDANLERWRWLPNSVPETYLRVNIAAFQLRLIQNEATIMQMKIIVGRPYRRTPVFSETIKYMVYNPYWNVPHKLATQDKLPLLKKDPLAMDQQGYEAKPPGSGEFLPVSTIDWQPVTIKQFNYLLRQKPGRANALGRIKFMLPNPYSVYLHDTPDQTLFAKQERSFSSGCIRLSDPLNLATWILQHDGQETVVDSIQQLDQGETKVINLRQPIPVLIVYFTAFPNGRNEVVFRRDIYHRDQAIVDALRKET